MCNISIHRIFAAKDDKFKASSSTTIKLIIIVINISLGGCTQRCRSPERLRFRFRFS
ncbi:hypothetical protein MTR_7g084265 [Medicago truncatula]|uniref:Uncharacterized protein n=1 Tax=Medicago truncatula TaxID=3880 RepID=A0A072U259_MEDTR|nr:hypothetical protein MTR_7g084265 [Medicago truncatula]